MGGLGALHTRAGASSLLDRLPSRQNTLKPFSTLSLPLCDTCMSLIRIVARLHVTLLVEQQKKRIHRTVQSEMHASKHHVRRMIYAGGQVANCNTQISISNVPVWECRAIVNSCSKKKTHVVIHSLIRVNQKNRLILSCSWIGTEKRNRPRDLLFLEYERCKICAASTSSSPGTIPSLHSSIMSTASREPS